MDQGIWLGETRWARQKVSMKDSQTSQEHDVETVKALGHVIWPRCGKHFEASM